MIYSVRWGSIQGAHPVRPSPFKEKTPALLALVNKYAGKVVDLKPLLERKIKENPKDSFVFIITNSGLPSFNQWLDNTGLRTSIRVQTDPMFNPIHPGYGKNLSMFVLQAHENHESTS